jgi:2-hydroxychromene-2-carboxylate isomerase
VATQIGLDAASFRACLSAPETQARLAADVQSGVRLSVNGTPSFLVQGKLVSADRLLQLLGMSAEALK